MAPQTLVIRKDDITKHHVAEATGPLGPLTSGTVRVQPKIVSLTRNNLTYAALGTFLKWWDTYPVTNLPSPYNDSATWGIVPAWGYGQVVETEHGKLPKGTLLYGYWPTSSAPVDLKLESMASDHDDFFLDVSEHRKDVMALYNRYLVARDAKPDDDLAWTACIFPTWQAGACLERFVFAPDSSKSIGPMGGDDWPAKNADLRKTVVVSLSATSKTATGFDWNLSQRAKDDAPLALLRVSNSPKDLSKFTGPFEVKETDYHDLPGDDIVHWVASQNPSRVVVADFGSTGGASAKFQNALLAKLPESADILQIWVGRQPDGSEVKGPRVISASMNTSPLMESAEKSLGIWNLSNDMNAAFDKFRKSGGLGDMELQWGAGVGGEGGLAAMWDHLLSGTAPGNKALVFRMAHD